MTDLFPIRPVTADELDGCLRVHAHAFNSGPSSPARQARTRRMFEPERSLVAFDPALPADRAMVGTAGAFSLRMTVPGATVPVAGSPRSRSCRRTGGAACSARSCTGSSPTSRRAARS